MLEQQLTGKGGRAALSTRLRASLRCDKSDTIGTPQAPRVTQSSHRRPRHVPFHPSPSAMVGVQVAGEASCH
eukprot:138096-Pyramimonas_sp.AAC.2